MPIDRIAVLAAVQTAKLVQNGGNTTSYGGYNMSSNGGGRAGRYETNLHGNVNILLGGAMMSAVIIVVVLMCYCCHRNIRKHRPHEYSHQWRPEPDVHSLEVFTMDAHAMCYERAIGSYPEETTVSLPCPAVPSPPPTYDSLIFNPHSLPSPSGKKDEPTSPGYILPVPMQTETGSNLSKNEAPLNNENTGDVEDDDDDDLPSYEAALRLEANGYV